MKQDLKETVDILDAREVKSFAEKTSDDEEQTLENFVSNEGDGNNVERKLRNCSVAILNIAVAILKIPVAILELGVAVLNFFVQKLQI